MSLLRLEGNFSYLSLNKRELAGIWANRNREFPRADIFLVCIFLFAKTVFDRILIINGD